MNRRGFLGSILALAAAPAIVRAESIMRVRPVGIDMAAIWREARDRAYLDRFGEAVDVMRENDIPPDADGNYIMFVHPSTFEQMQAEAKRARPLTKKQREQLPRGRIALLDNLIIRI